METIKKTVSEVLNPPAPHMVGDGFRVHNYFPVGHKIKMSPFYLLDYNPAILFSAREIPRGVGTHPHRGFETVTIAYQGAVAHHDSAGNAGVIYPGDVQWMTAGKGILHKEYHEKEFSLTGGTFQMAQLWVNLPAAHKMAQPAYQEIKKSQIARYELDEAQGVVEIIAGTYRGLQGPARTFTPVHVYNLTLHPGGKARFSFPFNYNTGLLIIEGSISVNQKEPAGTNQFVYFNHDGADFEISATEKSTVLILSGEPILEPIAHYGPFLMNSPEEIQQAISDYNQGRFGYLEE